jgi:D-ribose pyranase
MKKTAIINSRISAVIATMGHTDSLAIGDAGLPIPDCAERIDLAVMPGVPSFADVLSNVLTELEVEEIVLAEEIKLNNPTLDAQLKTMFADKKITYVSHSQFKKQTEGCKAVIRTGEFAPYANIILKSGVVF